MKELKILFIGDVSGKMGRIAVKKILLKNKKYDADLIIANAENAAHGSGITEPTLLELKESGVDFFTTGDHAFDRLKSFDLFKEMPIIRPSNYPPNTPGEGYKIINRNDFSILIINLAGRISMKMNLDCPFRKFDEIIKNENLDRKNLSAIIVDIHAETTAEKICLKHYIDGRASALIGTHTHIMTADSQITTKGTAYITDVGMAGAADESLGISKKEAIKTFLTQIKQPFKMPEKGRAIFNAVLISINPKNQKAKSIKPIIEFVNIK
jgi:2',3'-cyclic-nucleotide 2'-phosphodiesterase